MGASGGTLTLRNNTVVGTDTTTNLWNTVATTVNTFGAATTVNLGVNTLAQTINIASGATASGNTKTVNLGTSGATGSTTNINIGSANGGTTTINSTQALVNTDPTANLGIVTKQYADMRPTIITGSQNLVARSANNTGHYFVNHSAAVTLTLPASPVLGDRIVVEDITNTAGARNITIARNGQPIAGLAEDLVINLGGASVNLIYSNSTYGWRLV